MRWHDKKKSFMKMDLKQGTNKSQVEVLKHRIMDDETLIEQTF